MARRPDTIWDINKRRAVMKVPVLALCAQAGIGARTYYDALDGRAEPKPATLARLSSALARFKEAGGPDADLGPLSVHGCYRVALLAAATQLNTSPREVLAADPARRATADPEWMNAARTRRLAFWILNQIIGFKQADVARAANVTKQAVSGAIGAIRDGDDPDVKKVCDRLEEIFAT